MIQVFTYKDYLKYQKILKEKEQKKAKSLPNKPKEENSNKAKNNYNNIEISEIEKNYNYPEEKELNNISEIKEESEEYELDNKDINNEHDKIFRKVLDNKREAVEFINEVIKLKKKLLEEDLEKYNSSFVTAELRNKECDIVYKMKNRNVFFLIEHQTKIDYTMPLRILEYETAIIKSALDKIKLGRRKYKLPKVISIVLYTGKKKWNVADYIGKVQEELESYKALEVGKYNIVDANNYEKEELLEKRTLLSKLLLIGKVDNTKELAYYLEKIADKIKDKEDIYSKEQRNFLIDMMKLTLNRKLGKEETGKIIKRLEGGEKEMLAVLEMIDEENKRIFNDGKKLGIAQGKKIGRKEIKKEKIEMAKKMLQKEISIKSIIEITGLTEKEIEKISI